MLIMIPGNPGLSLFLELAARGAEIVPAGFTGRGRYLR